MQLVEKHHLGRKEIFEFQGQSDYEDWLLENLARADNWDWQEFASLAEATSQFRDDLPQKLAGATYPCVWATSPFGDEVHSENLRDELIAHAEYCRSHDLAGYDLTKGGTATAPCNKMKGGNKRGSMK